MHTVKTIATTERPRASTYDEFAKPKYWNDADLEKLRNEQKHGMATRAIYYDESGRIVGR